MPAVALTIAGSDPSGGAGVQADLKTFAAFGVYGAAVVTALTAQSTRGVARTWPVPDAFVTEQLDVVLDDLRPAAAKTGMLATGACVAAVASALARRPALPLVVDPVLAASTGQALADADVLETIRRTLLPRATLVTPNLDEAEALLGAPVRSRADVRAAAAALVERGAAAALVTGGHLAGSACDVLAYAGRLVELDAPRVPGTAVHGTGCALSAAITAALARGDALETAVRRAKAYVTRAIAGALAVGHGLRVVDHAVAANGPGGRRS